MKNQEAKKKNQEALKIFIPFNFLIFALTN